MAESAIHDTCNYLESADRVQPWEETAAEFRITEFPLHYVVFVQKHAQAAFARILKPHGLNNQSWRVLAALSGGAGQTIGQIAEVTVFDPANLGRTLDAMAQEGLVARQTDPRDRRAITTRITDAGRARFEAAHPDVRAIYDRLLAGFDPDELDALMSSLRCLKENCLGLATVFFKQVERSNFDEPCTGHLRS